jgi:hypothetical protein
MSDQSRKLGALLLISIWLVVIVGGFFASAVMSLVAFTEGDSTNGLVYGAIAIGCAVLCYRTYVSRDELRSNFK